MSDREKVVQAYPHASPITAHMGGLKYRIENRIKKRNNPALSSWKPTAEEAWADAAAKLPKTD